MGLGIIDRFNITITFPHVNVIENTITFPTCQFPHIYLCCVTIINAILISLLALYINCHFESNFPDPKLKHHVLSLTHSQSSCKLR